MKYKIGKIIKAGLLVLLLIITVSCISIDTEIKFSDNKSGTVKLKYSVSKMVIKTAEIDSDSSFLPLPLEEKDFTAKAAENENLRLVSFRRRKTVIKSLLLLNFHFPISTV